MCKSVIIVLSRPLRESTQWEVLEKDFKLIWLNDLSLESISEAQFNSADVIAAIMGDQVIGGKEMDQFLSLRTIARFGTGYNAVDVSAAKERGITVTRVSSVSAEPVSSHALWALGSLCSGIVKSHNLLLAGMDWADCRVRSDSEIFGLTVGVVGLGAIGRAMIQKLSSNGARICAWNRTDRPEVLETLMGSNVRRTETIADLVSESDAIVLCLALSDETEQVFNREMIGLMKPSALLINVGRGGLVDEEALGDALEREQISGAALDVFAKEPPNETESFRRLRQLAALGGNILLTAHIANLGGKTSEETAALVVKNVRAVLDGNLVDAEVVPT